MTGLLSLAATMFARDEKTAETAPALEFSTVYQENFKFVWRSLRGLGISEGAIDDAAQEVFLVVYRKLDTVTDPSGLKAWIFNITRRVASDQRRSLHRKGVAMEYNDNTTSSDTATPQANVENRQVLEQVEQFMNELDEVNRSIFVLSEIEELPVSQISQILEMNSNTIYSRLNSIRSDLTAFMARKNSGAKAGR